MPPRANTFEQILSRVTKAENGCWYYGAGRSTKYYVKIGFGGRRVQGHRLMYEHFVGPIPEGLELDHLCRNPACICPQHLEPVTHQENMRRGYALKPKKPPKPRQQRQREPRPVITVCCRGHEYTEANTVYRGRRRHRVCRICEKFRLERAKRCRLYGIPLPRRKLNDEQRAALLAGYPAKGRMAHWARQFGVSPATIRRELRPMRSFFGGGSG